MSEITFWVEMAKAIGLPAAVLFAWWYHNREQNKLWGQMLESNRIQTGEMIKLNSEQGKQMLENYKAQTVQMMDNTNKIWSTVMNMNQQQLNQQNEVLKGLLEHDNYQGAQLARMEGKIDSNQWCPLIKQAKEQK